MLAQNDDYLIKFIYVGRSSRWGAAYVYEFYQIVLPSQWQHDVLYIVSLFE